MPYAPGNRPNAPIGECGHPTWRKGKICRSCYLAAKRAANTCQDCGKELPDFRSDRCRACWLKKHSAEAKGAPKCVDCGKEISWAVGRAGTSHKPSRCWDCEVKRRLTLATGGKQARYKGQRKAKAILASMPCALCGYDRMPSHIHRLNPPLGYQLGNMVQLCSRCHNEVERGLVAVPQPTMLQ